jgi:transposase-like protein
MDQRTQFIADYLRKVLSVTELCDLYGVSRKTAYKWIERYLRQGPAGLEEHSRRPQGSPNQTPQEIVAAILEARRRHPSWGGKKLLVLVHSANATGICLTDPPCVTSFSATVWCPSGARADASAIRASRPVRFLPPTTCGAPTTKASSRQAMAATATR